jgi:hypothetical protein
MSDALVAVYPQKFSRGIEAPDAEHTYDWRQIPGMAGNSERMVAMGRVMSLSTALETRWHTDAHFVPYVLHDADGVELDAQPRVNKSALGWLFEQGFSVRVSVLAADLDNPKTAGQKTPWNARTTEAALEEAQRIEALRIGAWYFTAHGRRLIHVMRGWVDARAYEGVIRAWHIELRAQGLDPDPTCIEWNRLYGCPWLKRLDGKLQEQTPWIEQLTLRDPPGDPTSFAPVPRRSTSVSVPVDLFEKRMPAEWSARCKDLADAIGAVETEWHTLFLTLAGALAQRKVPLPFLPAIIGAVSAGTNRDTRQRDRVEAARTTMRRFIAGEPIAGFDQLLVRWPVVAAVVDRIAAEKNPSPVALALPSAVDAAREIIARMDTLADGVSVFDITCGAGKTYAAESFAAVRAQRGRSPAGRAKPGAKVSISEPTNEMAKQVSQSLRARGASVLRVFSPASEVDREGKAVCFFKDAADALASGGLSVSWELCEGRGQDPCMYRGTCPAADGQEGDEEALVMVGNHGLLPVLVKHAGVTGVRVIDEPPSALLTESLTTMDFAALRQYAHVFEPEFYAAISDAAAVASFLFDELREPMDLGDVFPSEVLESVRALELRAGPPLRWMHVRRAREQVAFAQDLGRAARCARVLCDAMRSEARWVVRIEARGEVPTLFFTGPNEDLVQALRADGATAVLEASPDVAGLSSAAGYDLAPRVVQFGARDGAPVARTHLYWSGGSRKALVEGGELQVRRFAVGLRAALSWAQEDADCSKLGLFTILPFRLLLECVQFPKDEERTLRWKRRGFPVRTLTEALDVLGPVLAGYRGEVRVGHYGRTRGLNAWRDCQATVTIGDPWPNLGESQNDALYLGVSGGNNRAERQARAELEQAHGRLRAPQRTEPGRMLHVGRLLPLGPGWDLADSRRMTEGRPQNDAALTAEELRVWIDREHGASIRRAAKALDLSHTALRRYLQENRAIPLDVARLVRGGTESLNKESLIRLSVPLKTPTDLPAHGTGASLPANASPRHDTPAQRSESDAGPRGEKQVARQRQEDGAQGAAESLNKESLIRLSAAPAGTKKQGAA